MVGYTIIGAGLAGLSLALELRRLGGVEAEVIEYRDYVGGIHSIMPETKGFINEALKEVSTRLITTAVRINDAIYAIWRGGYRRLTSNVIVATGGFRVMTLPELGIYGERPAGIYPHHAVLDMLHYDLLPGKDVVVYGDNQYALSLARELMRRGVTVRVISPTKLDTRDMDGGIDIIVGRVRYVKGMGGRVEKILVNSEWVAADTLVISMFKPFNPFPEFRAVGQAVIETYDPGIVIESGKIMAGGELVNRSGEFMVIDSDLPIYPGNRVSRDVRRVIIPCRGCRVMVNGREYIISNDAAVIELPDTDKVIIRRVVS